MAVTDEIYIGSIENPAKYFTPDKIVKVDTVSSVTIVGDELSADTFNATVVLGSSDSTLKNLPYGTNVFYYHDTELVGKYYFVSSEQIAENQWEINATSLIGMWNTIPFYGGIYQHVKFIDAIKGIVESNGFDRYELREAVRPSVTAPYTLGHHYPYGLETRQSAIGFRHFQLPSDGQNIQVSLKYSGFDADYFESAQYLKVWNHIFGFCVRIFSSATSSTDYYASVKVDLSRTSTSTPFSSDVPLYVCFGQTETRIGTIHLGDVLNLKWRGNTQSCTITVNGTDYTFSYMNGSTRIEWTKYLSGFSSATWENSPVTGYSEKQIYQGNITEIAAEGHAIDATIFDIQKYSVQSFYYFPEVDVINGNTYLWSPEELLPNILIPKYAVTGYYQNVCMASEIIGETQDGYNTYSIDSKYNDGQHTAYDHSIAGNIGFFNPTELQKSIYESLFFDAGLETTYVDGWIKVCKKRDALYQILFATGVNLIKNEDGNYMFSWNYTQTPKTISDDDVYIGGSVEYQEKVYRLDLTEHTFAKDNDIEPQTVFDNSNSEGLDYGIVEFSNAPIDVTSLVATGGLTIHIAGENAAIVSNSGVITGRPYDHIEDIHRYEVTDDTDATIKTVTDATMVTPLNGDDVAERLVNYYASRKLIHNDIVYTNQRCRGLYRIRDAFGAISNAYLSKMESISSGIIKSACTFIAGYAPDEDNPYNNAIVLTGNSSWTIPLDVYQKPDPKIRVIIVGGGNGGYSGLAGSDGHTTPTNWANAASNEGGKAGNAGEGGKILQLTFDLGNVPRYAVISCSCGEGGQGGAICTSRTFSNAGAAGNATTVTFNGRTYTSENGVRSAKGVYNFITGKKYGGTPPKKYFRAGGNSNSYTLRSYVFQDYGTFDTRKKGENVTDPITGAVYKSGNDGANGYAAGGCYSIGGCGGGAAVGGNGSNGAAATIHSGGITTDQSGNGGNGANATGIPPCITDVEPESFGYGGIGGYGGGAGGSIGTLAPVGTWQKYAGSFGLGGYGGKGGKGGAGCVIIYY